MKKPIIGFLASFIFLIHASGQNVNLDWMKQIGAAGQSVNGHYLAIDSNKYIYVGGYFTGTMDFDPGPATSTLTSNGSTDIYIAKYDTAGQFIWVRQIGSTPGEDIKGLKVDTRGNIIFTGYYQSTIDMDPGPGTVTVTNTGVNSFITKLNSNGAFIWSKQLEMEGCNVLHVDQQNNIYIGGDFSGTFDFDPGTGTQTLTAASVLDEDLFILKLNENGDYVWAKNMNNGGGATLQEGGIATDPQGNVFLAGNFSGPMDFDPGPSVFTLAPAGGNDCFLVTLDNAGNFRWAKKWGSVNTDKIWDLVTDRDGNIYTTGAFDGTVDFDPNAGTFNMTASSFRNCFISKLNNAGNFVFAKQFTGNSFGESITLDSSNNIYVAGGFYGPADFDPGAGVYTIDGGNIFITRLDANGNLTWAAAFQNQIIGSYESIYVAMKTDILKNVYYTGIFPFQVDFDPGPGNFNATPAGSNDMPIVKLNGQCRTATTSLTITTCDRYTLNGTTYSTSGTYSQLLSGSGGCDSLVVLNLTITRIQTQASVSSCGTYNWNGTDYSVSGVYSDTLTATNGCDSTIQLTLTIKDIPVPDLGTDAAICNNETISLYPGAFDSYQWNNSSTNDTLMASVPGIYWVTVSANGCQATDSITINTKTGCPPTDCVIQSSSVFYPNPCGNTVYFNKNNSSCNIYLNLYNALGQRVLKNELLTDGNNAIHMKRFAAGTYFFTMHSNGKVLKRGKIVKSKNE